MLSLQMLSLALPALLHLPPTELVSVTSLTGDTSAGVQEAVSPLLRETKFLMTHDAATGQMSGGWLDPIDLVLQDYLKTQDYDMVGQLDCGARALDLRVGKISADSPVSLHHAVFPIPDSNIEDVIPPVIEWAKANPTELVILMVSHCQIGAYTNVHTSGSCDDRFFQPFYDLGISVITNNDVQREITLAEAKANATLPGGGMVLALSNVPDDHNWPGEKCTTITMYGPHEWEQATVDISCALFDALKVAFGGINASAIQWIEETLIPSCGDFPSKSVACEITPQFGDFSKMDKYMEGVMANDCHCVNTIQGIWQELPAQILSFGGLPWDFVHNSWLLPYVGELADNHGQSDSLLGQVAAIKSNLTAWSAIQPGFSITTVGSRSKLNPHLVEKAKDHFFDRANFLLVNQINNQGPLLAEALGAAKIPPDTCPQALWQAPLCDKSSDCEDGACARPAAGTNTLVCCPSGGTTRFVFPGLPGHDGLSYEYCTGMPKGSRCRTDTMCASGMCTGGASLFQLGYCS